MGLSASQSRMLTLTARMSDLELKAQNISNQKIRLAEQSTEASKAYMDALDAQTLKFNYYSTGSLDATVASVTESGLYRVSDAFGNAFQYLDHKTITKPDGTETVLTGWYVLGTDGIYYESTIPQEKMTDTQWLYDQLQLANLFIQKAQTETNALGKVDIVGWQDYSYTSSSIFTTEEDTSGVAKAEAEYEYKMSEIESKDKKYDLDLENINTEHSAVEKEHDSVSKVIDGNVERTFTIFS